MITVEKWTVVRYLHAQGVSQRAIAKKLGISRNTVRRALETDEPPKYVRASEAISEKLRPFVDDIKEMFLEKKLIGSRILREIRGRGYQGSQSTLYRYLSQLKKKNLAEKACVGQQGQFDWSEYRVPIDKSITDMNEAVNPTFSLEFFLRLGCIDGWHSDIRGLATAFHTSVWSYLGLMAYVGRNSLYVVITRVLLPGAKVSEHPFLRNF